MWPCLLAAFIFSVSLSIYSVNLFSNILNNPPLLSFILVLALYIPFSSIFLLPIDLISSSLETPGSHNFFYVESKTLILNLWRFNYWLGFVMTWMVLPLIQCYFSSNNFIFKKRLHDSIIYNLKFYSVYVLVGIIGIVYVYFNIGLTFTSIKALIIIMSHSYSLILAIWFMGYGLVNLPKTIFWNSFIIRLNDRYLVNHYFLKLLNLKDEYHDSKTNFNQITSLIKNLHSIIDVQNNEYHKQWIEYLYSSVNNSLKYNNNNNINANSMDQHTISLQSNLNNYNNRFNQEMVLVNNQLSDEFLIGITKNFKDSYYQYLINESLYYALIKKVIKIQDIKNSRTTHTLTFRTPNKTHSKFSINHLINKVLFKSASSKYWYYYYLNPFSLKLYGLLLSSLSILIAMSEVFHNTKLSLINIIVFRHDANNNELITTMFILVLLSFMSFAALISLSKTKIFTIYKLIHKNSNPSSCVWYSSYAIRLTIPLCYNFLTLLNGQILSNSDDNGAQSLASKFQKSQFALFLGNSINLIGIGQSINNILPYFVLVPIIIQFYKIQNSHSKVNKSINVNGTVSQNSSFNRLRRKVSGIIEDFEFLLFDDMDDDYEDDEDYDHESNRAAYSNTNSDEGQTFGNYGDGSSSSSSRLLNSLQASGPQCSRKAQLIISRVDVLINYELTNARSLLNTYDDNYSIFYNFSLRHYLKLLFKRAESFRNGGDGVTIDGGLGLLDGDGYDDDAHGEIALRGDYDLEFEFSGEDEEEEISNEFNNEWR
ncbi:hypothetical protein DASC09_039210 [Saccharomycopsis crataegensis]|uniref:Uncharacterized protein n=1 Tax=Saccharomycopsis crataegensis TaxID=43959 RepID=A0AAV5QPF5_9ASCO|nr:hypothetical protein DASC09_039210 [Saccharomycopsis crataegensis]